MNSQGELVPVNVHIPVRGMSGIPPRPPGRPVGSKTKKGTIELKKKYPTL